VALSHRAGIAQDQIQAITDAQNNPARLAQGVFVVNQHSLLRRLAAARTSSRIALSKLAEGEERVDTLVAAAGQNQQQQQAPAAPLIQLPKMEVPIFRGDGKGHSYQKWRALFDSLVHNRQGLDDISKLSLLTQSLDSTAAALVANQPPTGDGYRASLRLLQNRFGDELTSVQVALNSFKDFNTGKSVASMRAFHDKLVGHCSLVTLLQGDYNHDTVLSVLEHKLDLDWRRRVEDYKRQRTGAYANIQWTVDEFMSVLNIVIKDEERIRLPASLIPGAAQPPVPGVRAPHQQGGGQQPNRQGQGGRRQTIDPNAHQHAFGNFQALDDESDHSTHSSYSTHSGLDST
jgi:hypothetical protein